MSLGGRIRQARKKLGISQMALGERVGELSRNSVSLWESDTTRPSTANLMKLPGILGVPSDWLLGDSEAHASTDVPLLTSVAAGRLQPSSSIEPWEDFPRIVAFGLPPGRWIALRVDGNSMNLIAPHDAVIFANLDDRDLVSGKDYVFATEDGEASFKRYRAGPDRFEPVSSYPGHETIFPQGPIRVIGRVGRAQIDF